MRYNKEETVLREPHPKTRSHIYDTGLPILYLVDQRNRKNAKQKTINKSFQNTKVASDAMRWDASKPSVVNEP